MSVLTREGWRTSTERDRRGPAQSVAITTRTWPFLIVIALIALAGRAIALAATEATMGHAQRVLYVHVAVAWMSLAGFLGMAAAGLLYLLRRDLAFDRWAQAAAEVGWLGSWLTLATGSLWARSAWGTWWTWDPRLISSFLLWALYGGFFLARAGIEEPRQRARVGALLSIIGALDVPLVIMATRWFRAIHPVSPTLEPSMRTALALSVLAVSAFACILIRFRRGQLELHDQLSRIEIALDEGTGSR